jgi:hypothetical protein
MYTGTLIDNLMDTVERVEMRVVEERSHQEEPDYWNSGQNELVVFESRLAGVA